MKSILIIGAGRSASALIAYLLKNAEAENWEVVVADVSAEQAKEKIGNHPKGKAIAFDVNNTVQRELEISRADLVVSMVPAFMHLTVAKECLKYRKSLITASYISKEIALFDQEAKEKGLIFLNEMGLDPGIDHMSAMKIIEWIRNEGGVITSFKSYCGGLIAPESDDNPWEYKFTWNPRNVVLAGQGTAQFMQDGMNKYQPYHRIFKEAEIIQVKDLGAFEAYPNRDSLSYKKVYGLEEIKTMKRGTIRNRGFCKAWNAFIQLGITDDTYTLEESASLTYASFLESHLPSKLKGSLEEKLSEFLAEAVDSDVMKKISWLGLLKDEKIMLPPVSMQQKGVTPAQVLQDLLERKWKLNASDKDRIIMLHEFEYLIGNKNQKISSTLVVTGTDQLNTAMALTVGLPMAIAAKRILRNQITARGVILPVTAEIYHPILAELEENGIRFSEQRF